MPRTTGTTTKSATKTSRSRKSTQIQIPQKRVVIVTGVKGGTGKTTFTRVLREILNQKNIPCAAYDSDPETSQFHRFYNSVGEGVTRINILRLEEAEADSLINDLESRTLPVVLVDLPGGAAKALSDFDKDFDFVNLVNKLGYAVTLVTVMGLSLDSVNALNVTLNFFGERVNYVAVKNLGVGELSEFTSFDNSNTRENLIKLNGATVHLPKLNTQTYRKVDEQSLPFGLAANNNETLTLAHRQRVATFLKQSAEALQSAGHLLGVPYDPA